MSYTVANHYIFLLQQDTIVKKPLTIEQFQPILETLADLYRDDLKLAFQAARPVGLSRHL